LKGRESLSAPSLKSGAQEIPGSPPVPHLYFGQSQEIPTDVGPFRLSPPLGQAPLELVRKRRLPFVSKIEYKITTRLGPENRLNRAGAEKIRLTPRERWFMPEDRGIAPAEAPAGISAEAGRQTQVEPQKVGLAPEEEKFRFMAEVAPLGIAIIGKDGTYKYVNPKFEEIFGYTLKDIPTGRDWFRKAYPDPVYRRKAVADWKADYEASPLGEFGPKIYKVRCKDGAEKMINFRAVALAAGDCLIFYEDITQRLLAEEALKQSEENYRLLVNQSPAVLFKGYADGRVDFFDRKIEDLSGYRKEDFNTGRLKWTDLILPEDAPKAREAFLQALKGNGSYVREYRIRQRDGGIRWIQGRGQIFRKPDGRIDYVSGLFFDITEHKKVEEALRQSEERYRLLVNQIPAVVFQGYPDWSIDFLDEKIEALTGYAKEDFDSRRLKWCDLIPPEELDYVKQNFIDALKTSHKSYVREHRIRKKSGDYAWVQCRGQIFLDDRGKAVYVSGVTFDITQRKRAEEALRESERRYRLLAENVSDVIWTMDLNKRFTYVSPSVQVLRGFTPEEVMAQSIQEILTPASVELASAAFAEAMALESVRPDSGRSWTLELEQFRKDGSTVWTEVKASFLRDEKGHPVGILGVTRDISKRKEAEDKLRRREAILKAVSIAAEKFLQSDSWEKEIQEILAYLGQAAEVSRAYIFENFINPAGEILTSQRYEWAAPGVEPQIDNPQLQNFHWRAAGFGRWEEELSQGRVIVGHVREFPSSEQELLANQDIKSILVMPIFAGPHWWGMIGFDACQTEREWSAAELEALKAAASILGTAIQQEQRQHALRRTEEKLRFLTAELIKAQEKERKRLAVELHDELGHNLLALKLSIRSLERELTPKDSLKKTVNRLLLNIDETIEGVRRLYHDLSPGDLEDLGLTMALRNMVEDFKELHPKTKWCVKLDNLDGLFGVQEQTVIYRVVQEALTNIGKHAQAKKVSLSAYRERGGIVIVIQDNGKGFDPNKEEKQGLGLLAMEERIKILGGSFSLWSQKNRGTKISVTVPFPAEK
jgi:PAS domain S-box-containing protein